jgi:ArsR family transcriptional regulator
MARRLKDNPLSDRMAELIARRFATLAEPVRIRLLDTLRELEEASVQEIADAVGITHANASKHLNLLYGEAILGRRKEKTKTLYRIADPGVFRLCDDVCGGIEQSFRELGAAFESPAPRRRTRTAAGRAT